MIADKKNSYRVSATLHSSNCSPCTCKDSLHLTLSAVVTGSVLPLIFSFHSLPKSMNSPVAIEGRQISPAWHFYLKLASLCCVVCLLQFTLRHSRSLRSSAGLLRAASRHRGRDYKRYFSSTPLPCAGQPPPARNFPSVGHGHVLATVGHACVYVLVWWSVSEVSQQRFISCHLIVFKYSS